MIQRRLLTTIVAALLFAVALTWAAGLFAGDPAPAGTLASDTIEITVGEPASGSRVVSEVTSLSPAGPAVLGSFVLLVASGTATAVAARRVASEADRV